MVICGYVAFILYYIFFLTNGEVTAMTDKIFTHPTTRFALVFQLALISLAGFGLFRLFLFLKRLAWDLIGHTPIELIDIFGQGLIYDIAFIAYFIIPLVILLLVLPNKWLETRPFKILTQVTGFLIVYGLGVCMITEWFFWKEFGVRFNYISVDYLVYRREVTENILQSYPVFWILPILFILSMFIFFGLRPYLVKVLTVKEKIYQRAVIALCLLLIPGCSYLFLDQSRRSFSDNNYVNELAFNGPYQLFAAFRNNTLDYRQFYKTGEDKFLSQILKQQISKNNIRCEDKRLYNITRQVKAPRPSEHLNVILISVERLSAKFLTRLGQTEKITPFMDGWFRQGKLFTNFYATGTRTTRGIEAITLSIPPHPVVPLSNDPITQI